MSVAKILIVEDDLRIAQLIENFLTKEGFSVASCLDGQSALIKLASFKPDLMLLDLMLPDGDGTDFIQSFKEICDCPILMLTALDDELSEIQALGLGVDDYLTKPIQPQRLLARVKVQLRRASIAQPKDQESFFLDEVKRIATLNGSSLTLTDAEFELLNFFIQHAKQKVSRDMLIRALRGFEYDGLDRSIDMRISSLRKKLFDDKPPYKLIKTIRGYGYVFLGSIGKK